MSIHVTIVGAGLGGLTLARVLAMFDGAELGKAIEANPGDVEAALFTYEQSLFPRSASAAADAEGILDLCLGPNSPHSLIDMLTGHQPAK